MKCRGQTSLISAVKEFNSKSITLERVVFPGIGIWSIDATYYCGVYVLVLFRPHAHTHAHGHDHDLGKGQARVSHSSPLFISSLNRQVQPSCLIKHMLTFLQSTIFDFPASLEKFPLFLDQGRIYGGGRTGPNPLQKVKK